MSKRVPTTPSRTAPAKTPTQAERRSPCPVACTLDIIGDRWTMLVVRDLVLGRSRFKEFRASPEGIPTNILADRLQRLVAQGLVIQVTPPEGGKHLAYQLTKKGLALIPVLKSLRDWGLQWEPGTRAALV
jgi:DNA-binding HxlR family transcriptional regulator